MRLKVFNFILFTLFILPVFAQFSVNGTVVSAENGSPIDGAIIYLGNKRTILSKSTGEFVIDNINQGKYLIRVQNLGYKLFEQEFFINQNTVINIVLEPKRNSLREVVIKDKKNDFGQTRLRAVEGFGIYEGKKSDVIIPDQLTANLATNNARQVYARVAGLNIFENEGSGLQLSIGGRGLDPNRSANFNVRQNGYDISADALGYPESYYTPATETVQEIQVVRGAASLQYGTQFGGLLNFVMREPEKDKKLALTIRQSVGSFGFYNGFISASGTNKKVSYYSFVQYKTGQGWRPNSQFDNVNAYANINYQLSESSKLGLDYTHTSYLAQQPGGLSDDQFATNARQSNRSRNWFSVNWNLFALHLDHKFNESNSINLRVFGLLANRFSVGFRPNRVETVDDGSERDLIKGYFKNIGAEARYLKRYSIGKYSNVLLAGVRYYYGFNHSQQGLGSRSANADFNFVEPDKFITYDYRFPNKNTSLFAENVFYVSNKVSITPGLRAEYIDTKANGYYGSISRDLAGNILNISRFYENRENARQFILAGLGLSYKPFDNVELYSNISQNYRSITFSDMRVNNPSAQIDQNLKDEDGYSFDVGLRSNRAKFLNYDVSVFYLRYNNRIGEIQFSDEFNRVLRLRTNVGAAAIRGVEAFAELSVLQLFPQKKEETVLSVFGNVALINSEYLSTQAVGVEGNKLEFVPAVNTKAGLKLAFKNFKFSYQFTYLSDQFSDATNARESGFSAIVGLIPAYAISDISMSYSYQRYKIEASLNNAANRYYFTRRATGYPGPGILPSDGRSIYLSLQVKI